MMQDTYEDEPLTQGKKKKKTKKKFTAPAHSSGTASFVLEGIGEMEEREEERKIRRRKRRDARAARIGKIVVSICCCLVFIGLICVLALLEEIKYLARGGAVEHITEAPSSAPTVPTAPTVPVTSTPTLRVTPQPTLAPITPAPIGPVENVYTLMPNQDTYIYRDGQEVAKSFGQEEELLVQHGIKTQNGREVPDAVTLLTFDMKGFPTADRLNPRDDKQAYLRLFHVPLGLGEQERDAANVLVSRMPQTDLSVEFLNGEGFTPENFQDGPTTIVGTTDMEVNIDVTSLIFGDAQQFENFGTEQLFFMLEVRDIEQQVGDRFYSRESDQPPQLIFTNMKP